MELLRCRIEEIADWHPHLFLEPHIVACGAILEAYSKSPAKFDVDCEKVQDQEAKFQMLVSWTPETADKGRRFRATVQPHVLVEMASVALAMVLVHEVLALGPLDVTVLGEKADYRSLQSEYVVEVSGTENLAELSRRHKDKVKQALANPFDWGAHVVVCGFSKSGHRIRLSQHEIGE
ncbi:MAG: hypothetical protein L0215_18470 [Gemmataceae bacterium]|nr:hypothetical protein [Gemmataceae bacterium]